MPHRSSGMCQHHYNKAHYAKNSAIAKTRAKSWREMNNERHNNAVAKWRENNKDKTAAYNAAYYANDVEGQRERSRLWWGGNKSASLEKHRKWVAENREKWNLLQARRRARRAGAEGHHTKEQVDALRKLQNGECAICGQEKKLTKDHIIPLSKGGSDWINNIQLVCQSCNSSKRDKTPEEFAASRGMPV